MTKEYVSSLPITRRPCYYTYWANVLNELFKSDEKIVKITIEKDDYETPQYAQTSATYYIQKGGYRMRTMLDGNDLYIYKEAIE